jgi:hypothetical protein
VEPARTVIEVAPTHVVVDDAPRTDPLRDEVQRRDRTYHAFVEQRRARRYAACALAVLALGVVAGVGLALPPATLPALAGAACVVALGVAAAALAHRGHVAGLLLAWGGGIAGTLLALAALLASPAEPLLLALTALLGALGVGALSLASLGLASWRGERAQRRLLRPGA